MRTQTISALFDGQDWLAESVDPTGWLAEPATGVDPTGGSVAASSADQQDGTNTPGVVGRHAQGGRAGGLARRTGRVRHLRRVRTESLRSGVAAPDRQGGRVRSVGRVAGTRSSRDTAQVFDLPDVQHEAAQAEVVQSAGVESAPEGYRMGRWARLALTATALAAIVVVLVSLTAGSASQTMVDVTVAPGDTLWSIAAQAAPDRDPRDVIDQIRQLNDMQDGVLPIGVVLRVPASAG